MASVDIVMDELDSKLYAVVKACNEEKNGSEYAGMPCVRDCPECKQYGGEGRVVSDWTPEGEPVWAACPVCMGKDSYEPGLIVVDPYALAIEAVQKMMTATLERLKQCQKHSHEWAYAGENEDGACYCAVCGISGDI